MTGGAIARPILPAERRYQPYTGLLPLCEDTGVLGTIQSRFQEKESGYWNSALTIAGFDRIGETGYRSNGLDYIPRRYCTARAWMSDGKLRKVTYWIGENTGFIGATYGVEWCVNGLDRNWAFAPYCREARP